MDRSVIERYEAGGEELREVVKRLGGVAIDSHPIPGTWSIRQIVVHLMDSDLIGSDRMKRIAAMENPLLVGYDESKFAELAGSERIDIEQAGEVFWLNRKLTARILRALPDSAFGRTGIHTEKGKVTLAEQVQAYVDHLSYHLTFIEKKRAMLVK
jgi:hypothetical protein